MQNQKALTSRKEDRSCAAAIASARRKFCSRSKASSCRKGRAPATGAGFRTPGRYARRRRNQLGAMEAG